MANHDIVIKINDHPIEYVTEADEEQGWVTVWVTVVDKHSRYPEGRRVIVRGDRFETRRLYGRVEITVNGQRLRRISFNG